jgi:MFS family permease
MTRIESNIPKLYLIVILRWLLLIMPILVLFFYDNGLTQTDVMILQSIFSIGIIVFEIPSGYFADVLGRRLTITLGSVISAIGLLIYALSCGFWGFLIAELTLGLGSSFISGADSAMLYDSLLQSGHADDYAKIEGRRTSAANFSETAAAIIGGLLATISLRFPFYVETALMFLTIPLAISLVEPPRQKHDNAAGSFKGILDIVRFSLHEHDEIKWLIFYSGVIGSSTLTMVWFIQPYLQHVGLPIALFGLVWAALNFSVGVFSMFAYKIEKIIGQSFLLSLLIPLSAIGYALSAFTNTLWIIPVFFIFYFVRGLHGPMLKEYINRLISSEKRATVLSVKNMIGRLLFTIIGPFIGWAADAYTFKTAFLFAGGIFLLCGSVALIYLRKHRVI